MERTRQSGGGGAGIDSRARRGGGRTPGAAGAGHPQPGGLKVPATAALRAGQPQLCPPQTRMLSPSSALGKNGGLPAQPRLCPAPALPASTTEPDHYGEAHFRGHTSFWVGQAPTISPSPRTLTPSDAPCTPGGCVLRAVDSHSQRFSKGYAKVTTQLTCRSSTSSVCLISKPEGHRAARQLPPHICADPRVLEHIPAQGDGRDGDNNNDVSISSTLGIFKSSHLRNEPIPAFCMTTCWALSAMGRWWVHSHITSWSTRQAGTPSLLCFKVTESLNGLG